MVNKLKNLSPAIKASIAFFIATLFVKGVSYITTPIFTRIMSMDQIGIVGYYSSWRSIYETIATLSLASAGVINVGFAKHEDDRNEYLSSIVGFCLTFSMLCGACALVAYPFIPGLSDMPLSLMLLIILHSVFTPAQSFWIIRERYELRYKVVFVTTVLVTFFSQLTAILAVYFCGIADTAFVRLLAVAAIEIPVGLVFMVYLIRKGRRCFDWLIYKETLLFALPLIPHYLSSVVLTSSDRIMIEKLDSVESAGIYTVVYGIGSIGTIVWGAIQGSVTPYIYTKLKNNSVMGISHRCEQLVFLFGSICVVISLIAPEVVKIMGPSSYAMGMYVVPPVVGAMIISSLYNLFSTITMYYKHTKGITLASIAAAGTNIVLNYIFIPMYGFVAAGYTTLFSYLTLALMHYLIMKKTASAKVYNSGKLFGICIFCILLCIFSSLFYNHIVLRVLLVLFLLAVVFLKRKNIKELVLRKG